MIERHVLAARLFALPAVASGCDDLGRESCVSTAGLDGADLLDRVRRRTCVSSDLHLSGDAPGSSALGDLVTIAGSLTIAGADLRGDLSGLDRVEEVGGSFELEGVLHVSELAVLPSLRSVGGALSIHDNPGLAGIAEWGPIADVGGEFSVVRNDALTELPMFDSLISVGGAMVYEENPLLTSIAGSVRELGRDGRTGLVVIGNRSLREIIWATPVEAHGDSAVESNTDLAHVGFPDGTTWIGGLRIVQNATLSELSIRGAASDIVVVENQALATIDLAVEAADDADIEILDNGSLQHVRGVIAADRLYRLVVSRNPGLTDVDVATVATRIGALEFLGNTQLVSISPFPELHSADSVKIGNNPAVGDAQAEALAANISSDVKKIARNQPEAPLLDPCPWEGDGECDQEWGSFFPGTNLCLADAGDCSAQ